MQSARSPYRKNKLSYAYAENFAAAPLVAASSQRDMKRYEHVLVVLLMLLLLLLVHHA